MQGQQLFYNNSTTLHAVTVFGSLFSNIYTEKDDELTAVPIMYQGVEKHHVARTNDDERNMIDRQLPMMSFGISSMLYDSVKVTGDGDTMEIECCCEDGSKKFTTMHPSPWILGFQLNVKAKTLTEGFMIIEQIIPYFKPTLNVRVKAFPDQIGECKFDRSDITLVGISFDNDFQGELATAGKRELTWTLDFTMTIPYWGMLNGYPGYQVGTGGSGGVGIDIEVGADYCGDNAEKMPIEHIFLNYVINHFDTTDVPVGIPDTDELFMPENGKEGHVSTTRIDVVDEDGDFIAEDIITQGTDYPRKPQGYDWGDGGGVVGDEIIGEGRLHPFQRFIAPEDVWPSIQEVDLTKSIDITPVSTSFESIVSLDLENDVDYDDDVRIDYIGAETRYQLRKQYEELVEAGLNYYQYLPKQQVKYTFHHASYQDVNRQVSLVMVPSEDNPTLVGYGYLDNNQNLTIDSDILSKLAEVGLSDEYEQYNIVTSESTVGTVIPYNGHTPQQIENAITIINDNGLNIYEELPRYPVTYKFTDSSGMVEFFDVQIVVTVEDDS